jgi:hypothetical protein
MANKWNLEPREFRENIVITEIDPLKLNDEDIKNMLKIEEKIKVKRTWLDMEYQKISLALQELENKNKLIIEKNGKIEDKKQKLGIYSYKNGDKYEGQIEHDINMRKYVRNGIGRCMFNSGDKYFGEWENGDMHGFGVYEWKNGEQYIGHWKNNNHDGFGILFPSNNREKYIGKWKSGKQIDNFYFTFFENAKKQSILLQYDGNGKLIVPENLKNYTTKIHHFHPPANGDSKKEIRYLL